MTYVIGSACIGSRDQSCVTVCPVDCIHPARRMLVIDPGDCIDCGACVPACPVDAIVFEGDATPAWAPFIAINAAIRDGVEVVDALVERWLSENGGSPP